MLDRILRFLRGAGAKSESDTDRDGFLSYAGETHALALGIYHGFKDFRDWRGLPEGYADGKNVERGWYPKFGYFVGAVIRVLCYLAIGGVLMNMAP